MAQMQTNVLKSLQGYNPLMNAITSKANPNPLPKISPAPMTMGGPNYTAPKPSPAVSSSATSQSQQLYSPSAPTASQPQKPSSSDSNGSYGYVDSSGTYTGSQNQPSNNYKDSGLYSSVTSKLADQSQSPYNQQTGTALARLNDIGQNQTKNVLDKEADYNKFAQQNPYMISAQHNANVASDVASGRSSLLGQTFGAVSQAKAQAVQNALQGQGQQITATQNVGNIAQQGQQTAQSALTQAGEFAKPVANAPYFGNPLTGNPVGSENGGSIIDSSVQNAIAQIKSGASTSDALATLSAFGPLGQQALIKEMRKFDPNWDITSSNAIAQQNMSQGQKFQEQATQLDTGLKQLDIITPTALDFLDRSGLNKTENPFFNKQINEYMSQLKNPADVKVLNALMGDIKKYTAQILGATGEINPTRIGEINDTFDPSLLNPTQLTNFLASLKKLGENQLSVLQNQSTNSYGGSQGYQGTQANVNTSLNTTAPIKGTEGLDNPIIQALIGGGINAVKGASPLISGLAQTILK